jgi:hypothetical protein
MSYNYSQMNDIIEKQYVKRESSGNNWFLEESIKFGKGYSKPGEYLQVIANKIMDNSRDKNLVEDDALYLDNKK